MNPFVSFWCAYVIRWGFVFFFFFAFFSSSGECFFFIRTVVSFSWAQMCFCHYTDPLYPYKFGAINFIVYLLLLTLILSLPHNSFIVQMSIQSTSQMHLTEEKWQWKYFFLDLVVVKKGENIAAVNRLKKKLKVTYLAWRFTRISSRCNWKWTKGYQMKVIERHFNLKLALKIFSKK